MKKKYFKLLLKMTGLILLPIFLYLVFAVLLSLFPVNTNFKESETGIDIFIKSNGVHTDIVVPVSNGLIDWREKVELQHFQETDPEQKYISFGWGDKGFYLHTPTWGDLKFSTAFKAMFWLGTSAMHVTYLEEIPEENKYVKKIRISSDQYKELIAHIDNSFQKDVNGKFLLIKGNHYDGQNDNFYEGIGTYSFFQTCNCWTNLGLKKSGVRTAAWAPFEWSVMHHRK